MAGGACTRAVRSSRKNQSTFAERSTWSRRSSTPFCSPLHTEKALTKLTPTSFFWSSERHHHLFHLVYLWGLLKETRRIGNDLFTFGLKDRNTLKWLEYSITATLGTLALAYSHPDHPLVVPSTLFFIAAVAVTEQATGFWDSIDSFTECLRTTSEDGPRTVHTFSRCVPGGRILDPCRHHRDFEPMGCLLCHVDAIWRVAGLRPYALTRQRAMKFKSRNWLLDPPRPPQRSAFGTILQEKGII